MSKPIADLQPNDRPRERLLSRGADVLSERELLALVLRNGRRGESALDLAATLLSEFAGLQGLSKVLPEELARLAGVGPAKASAVVAAFRIGRLATGESSGSAPLRGPGDVAAAAGPHVDGARRERLVVLICDSANRPIRVERISEGSVDRAMVPLREILNAVLRHDGRAFAIVHNHPSGDPTPSRRDREASEAVRVGAAAVGLRFLGHVVVAGTDWASVEVKTTVEGSIEDGGTQSFQLRRPGTPKID